MAASAFFKKAFGNPPDIRERKSEIWDCEREALAIPNFASLLRCRGLPQVADTNTPRQMDAAGGYLQ